MFIDKVRISVKAGAGGSGAVAFHREKYVAAGGPDGGDGGRGGSVGLRGNSQYWTLIHLKYQRHVFAKDGEAGFPGNLNLKVTYTLTNDNAVDIKYEATTDKPTVVNLTNHSYFNLSGVPGSQILDHTLMIAADTYVPVDATLIPTGTLDPVEGTPMDLRTAVAVGAHIDDPFDGH